MIFKRHIDMKLRRLSIIISSMYFLNLCRSSPFSLRRNCLCNQQKMHIGARKRVDDRTVSVSKRMICKREFLNVPQFIMYLDKSYIQGAFKKHAKYFNLAKNVFQHLIITFHSVLLQHAISHE